MTSDQPTNEKNAWTDPRTLIALAGFLSLGWTSYQQFQSDTAKDVAALQTRIAVLESRLEHMDEVVK